jgi:hypothetical protein
MPPPRAGVPESFSSCFNCSARSALASFCEYERNILAMNKLPTTTITHAPAVPLWVFLPRVAPDLLVSLLSFSCSGPCVYMHRSLWARTSGIDREREHDRERGGPGQTSFLLARTSPWFVPFAARRPSGTLLPSAPGVVRGAYVCVGMCFQCTRT